MEDDHFVEFSSIFIVKRLVSINCDITDMINVTALQLGTFQCHQVWETHFPLDPRIKTGSGKLGTSKGVQQLRIVLSAFSVNNRNNMFVYQEDSERRSGSFSERESVGGDQMSLGSLSLNRSQQYQSQQHLLRREDCIQLKVHGITETGPAMNCGLVRVLQNILDDAVLKILHSLLSSNAAWKLTSDDVHFIQKPHEPPHIVLQSAVRACAFPYLTALAYYLRQNLLDSVVYTPKYMDNFAGHHFQDYSSPFPSPSSDVYLYNRPQGSGNRGIVCISFSLVDGQGSPVNNLAWPRPITAVKTDGGVVPVIRYPIELVLVT
ncbi:hypothetical protein DAPPUDRAFT_267006 [Daphnia pulex]|uniref:Uncharacterized protein n=1 Tax=Daphnia pulex TaxID=6669 RepID=E9HVV8_DAPPU|nr:hypothetical protein DAPPUDRAFT_267006 [Daphnia pulex]|eukprot:EFX64124.1 hypothetical protein DAPPUDRAFT_267006 [Daphnia pulex]